MILSLLSTQLFYFYIPKIRYNMSLKAMIVSVSDFRATPTLAGTAASESNDPVTIDTSSGTTIDTFDQSGTASTSITHHHHHHQALGDEVTYVASNNSLAVTATPSTITTLKATTVAATTEVGFLTSEAEGTVETVVVRSSDISGSDGTQQLSIMDAYPIGQVTSTYLSYYNINAPKHRTCCSRVALYIIIIT
uniref:Secreted protein n=1 Tax=Elaeophora elaphi TaxID=1147741 RepID=A0A0R3S6B2_9BILA